MASHEEEEPDNEMNNPSRFRAGVSEDSPYGFPTLSRDYVNKIRTSLLLVTDEELRKVKKLPAQVVKTLPVVQMQLEPQIQKGSRSFKVSELMRVMPNSFEYKTLARNISPLPTRQASDSQSAHPHSLPTSIKPKVSSHTFSQPPRVAQISPPPNHKVFPSLKRNTSHDEFKAETLLVNQTAQSIQQKGPILSKKKISLTSSVEASPTIKSASLSPRRVSISPTSPTRGGSPSSSRGARVLSVSPRVPLEVMPRRMLKHTSPFKMFVPQEEDSQQDQFMDEFDFDAFYPDMIDIDPDHKLQIADRKKSVREPLNTKPDAKRRFSAFCLKEGMMLPTLANQRSSDAVRVMSANRLPSPSRFRPSITEMQPMLKRSSQSLNFDEEKEEDEPEIEAPVLMISRPDQDEDVCVIGRQPQIFQIAEDALSRRSEGRTSQISEEIKEQDRQKKAEEEKKMQNKERSKKAFKFLNTYVTTLKKVPREQKLSSLHKSLTTKMAAEVRETPVEQRSRLLSHIRENTELSESEEDQSSSQHYSEQSTDFNPTDRNHRNSLGNVSASFYSKMADVLAEMLRSTGEQIGVEQQPPERFRKYSQKLIDEMEEQHRKNQSYSSFYSDSSEEVLESEAVEHDIISQRRGSSQSQNLSVPVMRTRSDESGMSSGLKQEESGGLSNAFSFKLELKEVASPMVEEYKAESPHAAHPIYSYSSRDPKNTKPMNTKGAKTERLGATNELEEFFYGPDFMDWISKEANKPSRSTIQKKREKLAKQKRIRYYSPQYKNPYKEQPRVKSQSEKLLGVSEKILDTEKDFKLKIKQTEHKESDSDSEGLHEDIWSKKKLSRFHPSKRTMHVELSGVDRRTNPDWRMWYKYI